MESSAQVVVHGGGVAGASVPHHLTELGWADTVPAEPKESEVEIIGQRCPARLPPVPAPGPAGQRRRL